MKSAKSDCQSNKRMIIHLLKAVVSLTPPRPVVAHSFDDLSQLKLTISENKSPKEFIRMDL